MGTLDTQENRNSEAALENRLTVAATVRNAENLSEASRLFSEMLVETSHSLLFAGVCQPNLNSEHMVLTSILSQESKNFLLHSDGNRRNLLSIMALGLNGINTEESNQSIGPAQLFDRKLQLELKHMRLLDYNIVRIGFGNRVFVFIVGCDHICKDENCYGKVHALCDCFTTALGAKFEIEETHLQQHSTNKNQVEYNIITDRQKECLQWIASGKTSFEISIILGLSEHTVNNYINSACKRLNAVSRTQAVIIASQKGVINLAL